MIRLQPGEMYQVVTLLKPTTVSDASVSKAEYATIANVAARASRCAVASSSPPRSCNLPRRCAR